MPDELRFLVTFEKPTYANGQLLSVETHIVRMEDGKVRNLSSSLWSDPSRWAADLTIRAQADDAGFYGYRPEYKPYTVDLERAEEMLKTLRKIARGLDKLQAEFGYVGDYAQYIARVASVLGIKRFGWIREHGRGDYDDCEFHWTDPAGIAYHVQAQLDEFRKVPA